MTQVRVVTSQREIVAVKVLRRLSSSPHPVVAPVPGTRGLVSVTSKVLARVLEN